MESKIYFQPFVGKDYANGGIFGKRIMVLGESHYITDDSGSPSFTNEIVDWHLDPKKPRSNPFLRTFVKFERTLIGEDAGQEERVEIWNSLLFYNYLQVPMGGPREAGTFDDYQQAAAPFYEVIERYQPEHIIVWGYRLWDHLPRERWEDGESIVVNGTSVPTGYYTMTNGKKVKVLAMYHPSSPAYEKAFWHRVISEFLK